MLCLVNFRNLHQKCINLNSFHTKKRGGGLSFSSCKFTLCNSAHLLMTLAKGDTSILRFHEKHWTSLKKRKMYMLVPLYYEHKCKQIKHICQAEDCVTSNPVSLPSSRMRPRLRAQLAGFVSRLCQGLRT